MPPKPRSASNAPPPALQALRTWEERGRGWWVSAYPVKLEPPFMPFQLPPRSEQVAVDDGRSSSRLSAWLTKRKQSNQENQLPAVIASASPAALPLREEAAPLSELQVYIPPSCKITAEQTKHFLLSLNACRAPLSFEVIGVPQAVTIQFTCRAHDLTSVTQQLKAHFPEIALGQEADFLARRRPQNADTKSTLVEFGLGREFFLPLQTPPSLEPDLLTSLIGSLSSLQSGESGVAQILFQPLRSLWSDALLRISQLRVGTIPLLGTEMQTGLRQKISSPLFAVALRVEGRSPSPERAWQIVRAIGATLSQLGSPVSNTLIPLAPVEYPPEAQQQDLLTRMSRRSGMIWNCAELLSLAHPPTASVRSPWLQRWRQKTKAFTPGSGTPNISLGSNAHAGQSMPVILTQAQRMRHMHVIGATGVGKSTFLQNCILQDLQRGDGVAVFDPHGELVRSFLPHIPPERWKDVILFDPADQEFPIGFNILFAHNELEKTLLISDLVSIFRRFATSFGDQMEMVLGQAISAMLESTRKNSLLDLKRFLAEPAFRSKFLTTITDTETLYYWQREFPLLKGNPTASLLTRLDAFLRSKLIRQIVGQRTNRLDIRAIMDQKKILLVNLGQGLMGRENSALLGALLLAKIQQMALSRQELAMEQRAPFHIYLDEFQELISPSIAGILAGGRKYQLSLTLAHQELQQIRERSVEVMSAVLSNPATRVCFRVSETDAAKLAEGFALFEATDLLNLGVGEAIARIERADHDFNLHTAPLPEIEETLAQERAERLIQFSRAAYGTPRAQVELEMAQIREMEREPLMQITAEVAVTQIRQAPVLEPEVSHEPDLLEEKETDQSSFPAPLSRVFSPAHSNPAITKLPKTSKLTKEEGNGGAHHRYLQALIKNWGEEKGFRATIEKTVPTGSVDVALEREGCALGVEVSVTNTVEYEVGNLQKCLTNSFDPVVLVTTNQRHLAKIKAAAKDVVAEADFLKLHFFLPEEFFIFLEQFASSAPGTEEIVKGYKVKVKYKTLSQDEQQARKTAIAKTVINAMKRLKETE